MDLSRNPEYARVASPPLAPSPERRAAELEILQKVQSGELTPQEAVQRLASLDGGPGEAMAPAQESAAPEAEASTEGGEEVVPAAEDENRDEA